MAFSPDGKWLAGGSGQQVPGGVSSLSIWDLETWNPVSTFDNKAISVWGVAFSPDGKRVAAAIGYYGSPTPGEIRVWDTTNGELFSRAIPSVCGASHLARTAAA